MCVRSCCHVFFFFFFNHMVCAERFSVLPCRGTAHHRNWNWDKCVTSITGLVTMMDGATAACDVFWLIDFKAGTMRASHIITGSACKQHSFTATECKLNDVKLI